MIDSVFIDLENTLNSEFFGQHLAADTVLNALRSHLNHEDSKKALVLSFHGWAGSGKTYLAELVMKSLYKEGSDSKFVKFYIASYHFPDPNTTKVLEYQVCISFTNNNLRKFELYFIHFLCTGKTSKRYTGNS